MLTYSKKKQYPLPLFLLNFYVIKLWTRIILHVIKGPVKQHIKLCVLFCQQMKLKWQEQVEK